MDESRFDGLTRKLANGMSRRHTLQGLAGGALAGLLAHLGLEEASAACVKLGKKGCKGPKNKKCCQGAVCKGGGKTKPGTCVCKGGLAKCGTSCVNTQTSTQHCGACNNSCGEGQTCAQGSCDCPATRTQCGTACVDTGTDTQHCGGCDQPCPARETCVRGACVFTGGCPPGKNYCDEEEPGQSRCPNSTNTRCNCITDHGGTTYCAYTDFTLYCSTCTGNNGCPDGWACHDARGCDCPFDPQEGFPGNACVQLNVAAERCL